MRNPIKREKGETKRLLWRYRGLYLILLVAIAYYFVFQYIPIIWQCHLVKTTLTNRI